MSRPDTCRRLMDMVDAPNLFDTPAETLLPLQLKAADDLYQAEREKIVVLRQRGDDCGVDSVNARADLVPLLFSHSTYKSYPESFVSDGRWPLLTRWYDTVSAVPVDVDMAGVDTIDDWVDRLWENGHFLHATSGTTGKCSFLNHTKDDRDFVERYLAAVLGWPNPIGPGRKWRFYRGMMPKGPQTPMHWFDVIERVFALPDASFALGKEPFRVSHINRVGAMRKAMAENTTSPAEVAAFEEEMRERERAMEADIIAMAEDMAAHRDAPMIVQTWLVMYALLKHLRALDVPDGAFPNVFLWGNARKKLQSPISNAELEADALRFFQPARRYCSYGMSELSVPMPMCEAGSYHVPPWIIVLPLDRPGNILLSEEDADDRGVIGGRGGFMDLSREGRWGGVISGDKIEVKFGPCACGRRGTTILDTVTRYSDAGDDKVDCGGSFDAYVRGVLNTQVAAN